MKPGQQVGRKEPCPCGSGVLYKSCCFADDREAAEGKRAAKASVLASIIAAPFNLAAFFRLKAEKMPFYKRFKR